MQNLETKLERSRPVLTTPLTCGTANSWPPPPLTRTEVLGTNGGRWPPCQRPATPMIWVPESEIGWEGMCLVTVTDPHPSPYNSNTLRYYITAEGGSAIARNQLKQAHLPPYHHNSPPPPHRRTCIAQEYLNPCQRCTARGFPAASRACIAWEYQASSPRGVQLAGPAIL